MKLSVFAFCCLTIQTYGCQPQDHHQSLIPLVTPYDAARFAGLLVAYHHYPYEEYPALAPLSGPLQEQLSIGWVSAHPVRCRRPVDDKNEYAYCMKKLLDTNRIYLTKTYIPLTRNTLNNTRIEIRTLTQEEQKCMINLIAAGKARFDQTAFD